MKKFTIRITLPELAFVNTEPILIEDVARRIAARLCEIHGPENVYVKIEEENQTLMKGDHFARG